MSVFLCFPFIQFFHFLILEFGGSISVSAITDFIDNGGNVFVTGSSNVGDAIRDLASNNGFEIDDEGTSVIDHLNYDVKDTGHHNLIVADPANLVDAPVIVGDKKKLNPILFRGAGLITDKNNPLTIEVLAASSTAYSYNPSKPITEVIISLLICQIINHFYHSLVSSRCREVHSAGNRSTSAK